MWFIGDLGRTERKLQRRQPLRGRLMSHSDVKARQGRAEHKKKARPRGTRLPTKTYGNCLLGLHSIQKACPETRASAQFPVVAGRQQQKLSTTYPQALVGNLWMSAGCGAGPTNQLDFGTKWPENQPILAAPPGNSAAAEK